jgi:ferrochelatase
MSYGTPESLDQMGEFLRNIFGRPAPEEMVRAFQERYRTFGGRSPLLDIARRQAAALEKRLGWPVRVGMRHWRPFIGEAVAGLGDPIVGVSLAAQYSPASVGKNFEALRAAAASARVIEVREYHLQPAFIEAWVERVRAGKAEHRPDAVLYTAHSVPEEGAEPYPTQLRETIERIGIEGEFAYQSAGPGPRRWLGPDVDSKLRELHARGVRRVLAAPVGFVSDHAEILYDLDRLHRKTAEGLGMYWARTPMLNDDPRLIEAIEGRIRSICATLI